MRGRDRDRDRGMMMIVALFSFLFFPSLGVLGGWLVILLPSRVLFVSFSFLFSPFLFFHSSLGVGICLLVT